MSGQTNIGFLPTPPVRVYRFERGDLLDVPLHITDPERSEELRDLQRKFGMTIPVYISELAVAMAVALNGADSQLAQAFHRHNERLARLGLRGVIEDMSANQVGAYP